jgi:hypothetical protein
LLAREHKLTPHPNPHIKTRIIPLFFRENRIKSLWTEKIEFLSYLTRLPEPSISPDLCLQNRSCLISATASLHLIIITAADTGGSV